MTAPQPRQEAPLQVPGAGTVCVLHNGAILCQTPLYFLKRQLILKTKNIGKYILACASCFIYFPRVLDSMGRTEWLSSGLLLTEATLPGLATSHKLAFFS